jgi:hypothetical protein
MKFATRMRRAAFRTSKTLEQFNFERQALGDCAVRQGTDVLFTTCTQLTASPNTARATGAYERRLASLVRIDLLIIDDFAQAASSTGRRGSARADRRALRDCTAIVTSNRDPTEWNQAFPSNRLLASATLDRMRHNAYPKRNISCNWLYLPPKKSLPSQLSPACAQVSKTRSADLCASNRILSALRAALTAAIKLQTFENFEKRSNFATVIALTDKSKSSSQLIKMTGISISLSRI